MDEDDTVNTNETRSLPDSVNNIEQPHEECRGENKDNNALAQTHIKEKQLKAPFQSAHEYKENNRISKIHDDTQTNKRENEKKDKDEINEARGHTNEGTIGSGGDK